MPFRQLFVVILALVAVVGAALFIMSWEGDDGSAATISTTTAPTADETTTTTLPITTTSIPVACGSIEADVAPTTTTTPTTSAPPTTTPSTTTPSTTGPTDGETTTTTAEIPLIPTLGNNSSLSTVGLDEVTFGLTVSQARQAAGTEFDACEPVSECYRVTPTAAPDGISFVVDGGTIERVDIVGNSPINTVSGAGIGTTDDELTELFGARLDRTELGGGAVDVVFVPTAENDAEFRVIFTVVEGAVEAMRAGRLPLVLEADACA